MTLRPDSQSTQAHNADGREGIVLLIVMLIVASMTILGGVALMVSKIQVRGVTYYRHGAEAFANADSGARHVFRRITESSEAETLSLDGAEVAVNFPAPTGFDFDTVTNLTRLPDGVSYLYRVVGRSREGRATVEAVIRALTHGVPFGIFGGGGIELGSNAELTSGVGSNGDITLRSGSKITGDATPGPGYSTILDGGTITGTSTPMTAPLVMDPVDPVALANAMSHNNNAALPAGYVVAGKLFVKNTALLMPAGTYFFTEIEIGSDLSVSGKVVIYCTGEVANKSSVVIGTLGRPDDLEIYTTTTGAIDIGSSSEWYGHIYAPNASGASIGSSSMFTGSLACGGLLTVRSSATFDMGGAQRWTDTATLFSWKEVRP